MLLVAAAACGPSKAEVRTAKNARYATTPDTLFAIALQVAQNDYTIGETDREYGQFITAPQFYSADGMRQSPGAGGYVNMSTGTVQLSLIVEVVAADGKQMVVVTPKTFQVVMGSPKPRELAPDDPNLPGWVHGRVDALTVAIYKAAKQHAVQ